VILNSKHELAIIIPAYRARYLETAMASIVEQTDQRFSLYVFDDASPDPIADLVKQYDSIRPISFHRFDKNLGGTSLVKHWQRCLELTTEPWVWLFSDDDLMDPTCVERFLKELGNSGSRHNLYRFNTRSVDATGMVICENEPHPCLESGENFLITRFQDKTTSILQELVFSRLAYERTGGIPDFPLAWAADDAFIAKLGTSQPIKTIAGPRISWRRSGINISTDISPAYAQKKNTACQMHVNWALEFFAQCPGSADGITLAELRHLTSVWFFRRVCENQCCLSLKEALKLDEYASRTWGWFRGVGFAKCLRLNLSLIRRPPVRSLKLWTRPRCRPQ
jgi:hypothetical protein